MTKDMDQQHKSGGYKVGVSKQFCFLNKCYNYVCVPSCTKNQCFTFIYLDPQGTKTGSSPASTSTPAAATKRVMEKTHAASPVKRAKTVIGKQQKMQH